jgi:hypothetical protein
MSFVQSPEQDEDKNKNDCRGNSIEHRLDDILGRLSFRYFSIADLIWFTQAPASSCRWTRRSGVQIEY